jgi:hypothetical protein
LPLRRHHIPHVIGDASLEGANRNDVSWSYRKRIGVVLSSQEMFPQELPDPARCPICVSMFKIVLQPEEDAMLCAIRDGLCPAVALPAPLLHRLMALRLLKCDEHGNPRLTDLAEAALARMRSKIH